MWQVIGVCVCVWRKGGGRHIKVTNKVQQEMTKGDINLRTSRDTDKETQEKQ